VERISPLTEAKQIDIVDYMAKLGYEPTKKRNNNYWYLSPLRNEKTPSFKVNRKLNVWFDFGEGIGGNLIDFGIRYFNCSVSDFLRRINQNNIPHSFHPQIADEKKETPEGKILILGESPINSKHLIGYLEKRRIPLNIAERFCRELEFSLYGKKQSAIGFKNNAGGYELRSEIFKGSSSPKDITTISNNADHISVFEGFFNFLSWQVLSSKNIEEEVQRLTKIQTDILVLNSLSFFDKTRQQMQKYNVVNLFLDRDSSGIKVTRKAILSDSIYKDRSELYKGFKDLNDKLTGKELIIKQVQGMRNRF